MGFDVIPPIGVASTSRDLMFLNWEMKNIKKDTFIKGDCKKNVNISVTKTKRMTSCAVTAHLICTFVFAYAKILFSQGVAHIVLTLVLGLSLGWKIVSPWLLMRNE